MSRYRGPKARLCRREGMNLFGRQKYDKILEKRPGKPGQHAGRPRKMSGYAVQLREKQKLRYMFGVNEGKLRSYFGVAINQPGITADNLMTLLETRLDNVIYRSGLALTRFQSRQMSTHGHFLVNGRRVDVPSYKMKVGDVIELRSKLKDSALYSKVREENKGYKAPRWLKVDTKGLKIEVVDTPTPDDFERVINVQKIIEFYSR